MAARYTNGLKRFVTRCCGLESYRLAADNLQELCVIHLSPTTIGNIADETAVEIAAKKESDPAFREAFQKAEGSVEFYIDGTCIPIRNEAGEREYREVRVGAYAKREPGESATPSQWGTRPLPEPTVVSAFAAIENKAEFQKRCQTERCLFGVGRWGVVDMESCVDGVRQDGGVLGHLSCIGTCFGLRKGVIRERFGFYGLV